jgi:1,4-alpha-glucan branching enzyme
MFNNNATSTWRWTWDRLWFHVGQKFRPVQPATRPGMGAIPAENGDPGVTFRVWAPHAERVFVIGNFNNWSPWRTPLAREGGAWSVDAGDVHPGDQYRFVIQHNGQTLTRTDPYARAVVGAHDDGVVVADLDAGDRPDAQNTFTPPAIDELVIYELHVGTFAANGTGRGTFDDVIAKLPYLQELGINAIELMPVAGFPGDRSWGYNPAHLFAVAEAYGGRPALKKLVQAAHAHGIAVILDVVYNHFGPDRLSLWRFDGWHENGSGGIYFYNDWRNATPWGHTRPDYGRPEVRAFIRDNVFMWLDEFGVDGLRWDATSYIRNAHGHDGDPGADIAEGWQLMQGINAEMASRYPHHLRIAEDMQGNPWLVQDTPAGGAGFHTQWDAGFAHAVRAALIGAYDETRDMAAISQAIAGAGLESAGQRVIFTESHDEVANGKARVPEEIAPGDAGDPLAHKRAMLGAGLVFTAPGIPMIFQGQEFAVHGWFDDRVLLPWELAEENAGMVRFYRELIRLRRNLDGHSAGLCGDQVHVYHVDDEAKVIAFHRWQQGGPGDDVVVVANFSHRPVSDYPLGFPAEGAWPIRLDSHQQKYGLGDSQDETPAVTATPANGDVAAGQLGYAARVNVAPYTLLALSQS